jgi:hypothetical protein
MAREVTEQLIEMVEEGILSWEMIARGALCYMSEDDVREMARNEELLPYMDEDEDDDMEWDWNNPASPHHY